jgi:hypothetical protein
MQIEVKTKIANVVKIIQRRRKRGMSRGGIAETLIGRAAGSWMTLN